LLRRLPFTVGTPSHDHLGDLSATLDAECFQRCFSAWVASFTGLPEGVWLLMARTRVVPNKAARRCFTPFQPFPNGNGWFWSRPR